MVFDDLEEATGMSEDAHRAFFHQFVLFGDPFLCSRFVNYPKNAEQATTHVKEFKIAGMSGGVGSMDATHIMMEKCSHRLKQNHLGGKSKQACRSFNLTANHRREMLHSTSGHPSRWNDKAIVLIDEFATQIRKGKVMMDNVFELMDHDDNGEACSVKCRGAWSLVDNGCLNWSTTMPPMKKTIFLQRSKMV